MAIFDAQSLADLVTDPRETLGTELKTWLDIVGNNEHKALLGKSIIALANHGGGAILIGFEANQQGAVQASPNRPANLAGFTPDTVNAVARAYAEPSFHCDVRIVRAPSGLDYPVVIVPGGHRVPVRCRRDGPNGHGARNNTYYTRLPGPRSEQPTTGAEWDELMQRCLQNGREDLANRFRAIMDAQAPQQPVVAPAVGAAAGVGVARAVAHAPAPRAAPAVAAPNRLDVWFASSLARWQEVIRQLPEGNAARMPLGYYAFAYVFETAPDQRTADELRRAIDRAAVPHTGWPMLWVPTREGIRPYVQDGNIECWMARDGQERDASHSDFWRVAPEGSAFIVRGYAEDGERGNFRVGAGEGFDLTLPTWRVGEFLLHADALAQQLGIGNSIVAFKFHWAGLRGRKLIAERRAIFDDHVAQTESHTATLSVQADQIPASLVELTARVVNPLYQLFDFFTLPSALVSEELEYMRRHRF